ncbi:MAG: hypothetical protein U9R36_02910 [Elusimicrobiota bacterium]|nr:hypothetical protein [Elusimicrobiota bacterium]
MAPVLKLSGDDEEKEIDFELDWLLTLSDEERFEMLFKKRKQIISILKDNGHKRPDKIIKRKCR